jgi:hypothetical protein
MGASEKRKSFVFFRCHSEATFAEESMFSAKKEILRFTRDDK